MFVCGMWQRIGGDYALQEEMTEKALRFIKREAIGFPFFM